MVPKLHGCFELELPRSPEMLLLDGGFSLVVSHLGLAQGVVFSELAIFGADLPDGDTENVILDVYVC